MNSLPGFLVDTALSLFVETQRGGVFTFEAFKTQG